jgi:hypothetical protein
VSETRKLVATLVADVAGYSRLAGTDEERTLARLRGGGGRLQGSEGSSLRIRGSKRCCNAAARRRNALRCHPV